MIPTCFKVESWMLRVSVMHFASETAITGFGALNAIFIGFYVDATQEAYWGTVIQLECAVNSLYSPITSGIHPSMTHTESFDFI